MKPATIPGAEAVAQGLSEPSTPAMRVLQDYLAKLERGVPPHPEELLAEHPELAEPLKEYLASLEFLHGAALNLRSSDRPPKGASAAEPVELGQLGDFRILREVGRGGMGVVYEAEQISLGRRVALKVLPFAGALDARQLQRFKNEAQAAAHLQHQHIVPVHYVGCERGVHFYAMQYIDGQSLAKMIADLRLQSADCQKVDSHSVQQGGPAFPDYQPSLPASHSPICDLQTATSDVTPPVAVLSTERFTNIAAFFRMVANLGVQAAEALEHAHQLGIIHRDIKPANLLATRQGILP